MAARPGRWGLDAVYELFPRLKERRGNMGNQLSGGEQQMLAIARALMTNPALLLLDEPLEGLAPIIVEELAAALKRMADRGHRAIVLVEQHTEIALALTQDAVRDRARPHRAPRALEPSCARDDATLERYVGLKVQLGGRKSGPRPALFHPRTCCLVLLVLVGRAGARSGALARALALRVAVAALLIGALALVRLVGRAARAARALVACSVSVPCLVDELEPLLAESPLCLPPWRSSFTPWPLPCSWPLA